MPKYVRATDHYPIPNVATYNYVNIGKKIKEIMLIM